LRDRTEWVETVEAGVSFLVGTDANRIVQAVKFIEDNYDLIRGRFCENPFGDGCAARRIVDIVMRFI
jgi:UDP-N-acetylglucosamine 2-epimerase